MRSGGEGSTLSVWSLETQEFWRARELHVTSSIPSLCWLSRSELVVALGTLDAVGLVNVESGALVRRRGAPGVGLDVACQVVLSTLEAHGSHRHQRLDRGGHSDAPELSKARGVGRRPRGTRFKRRVTVFNASSSGCVLSAALLNTFKLKRCPPVVALNEQGQFLAVPGREWHWRLPRWPDWMARNGWSSPAMAPRALRPRYPRTPGRRRGVWGIMRPSKCRQGLVRVATRGYEDSEGLEVASVDSEHRGHRFQLQSLKCCREPVPAGGLLSRLQPTEGRPWKG